jgi:hypothetical protein
VGQSFIIAPGKSLLIVQVQMMLGLYFLGSKV